MWGGDVAHTQVWIVLRFLQDSVHTNLKPYFGLIDQRVDWVSMPTSLEGSSAFRTEAVDGLSKWWEFQSLKFSLRNHDVADPP